MDRKYSYCTSYPAEAYIDDDILIYHSERWSIIWQLFFVRKSCAHSARTCRQCSHPFICNDDDGMGYGLVSSGHDRDEGNGAPTAAGSGGAHCKGRIHSHGRVAASPTKNQKNNDYV